MVKILEDRLFDDPTAALYRNAVKAFVRRRVSSDAEADDLAQEAFVRLCTANNNASISQPQAYLFRIARNLIVDHQRKSTRSTERVVPYEDSHSPVTQIVQEVEIIEQNLQKLFEVALSELSEKRRRVFIMKRFENRSTLFIAFELGITPRMVRKHLILAVSHLYERLKPHMEQGQ